MLSFLYALVALDARAACEAHGLDPQMGFLHRDRPGRMSLALDLMEELRAPLADRVALSLVNRRQLAPRDFEAQETGAVLLTDDGRRTVLRPTMRASGPSCATPGSTSASPSASCRRSRRSFWPGICAAMSTAIRRGSGSVLVLVTYDVAVTSTAGRRRCVESRAFARTMVSACSTRSSSAMSIRRVDAMRARLIGIIDPATDSLRFYMLGREWRRRVEHVGARPSDDPDALLIV